jgi:ketosteroid isomerase-like protein
MELPPSVPMPSPAPIGESLSRIFTSVYPRFQNGRFDVAIQLCVADGDTVIVEYQARGVLLTGREFLCRYLAILETEDGRLRRFRPYTDTKYITDVLLA